MGLRGFSRGIGRLLALGFGLALFSAWSQSSSAWAPIPTCPRLFEDSGPTLRLELPGIKRDPTAAKLKRLKVAHYSLYLFNYFPEPGSKPILTNKDAIIQTILHEKPDVLTLSEVMNKRTLEELARQLDGLYEPFMIEGNEDSSVAVLIRKTLPLTVEIASHRAVQHKYVNGYEPLFTRDLLLVHLTLPGATRPLLTLGASHLKAQKDNFKGDPGFVIKRREQERGALAILDVSGNMRASRARIFIGDMNSDVRRQNEMRYFKEAGYQDALNVLGIPMDRRASHSHFPRDGVPEFWQTDAAFVSREIALRNGGIL